ncbi:MAG: cation:proton antiporter [Phycisphaeraceae bacterium]|nr:cation:proton antiporter [Phycisphaeraceae bacterium]
MHHFPLLTTLAAGFTAAWALGLITQRIGLSPIVGYLLAGILIGPYTPGIVADVTLAPQLAELGVILLMFGVGLHFHLKDLLAVRSIAVPGAVAQSLTATIAGAVIFKMMGWPLSHGLVLGMAMAVASTVVLIRMLIDNLQLNTPAGHASVGWLIVEDIFTVIILVILPAMAGGVSSSGVGDGAAAQAPAASHWLGSLGIAMIKLAIFVALLYFVGSKIAPWLLVQVAKLRSRELFTLTVLVFSIAVATGASVVFGASVALGAFLAGMVVAQSPVSHQAGIDALPMRDAFAVLFFVAVGMLFDPKFILEQPGLIVAGLSIVMIVKPLAAIAIVCILGFPMHTALTVAIALAQIGEFSFILGDLAYKHQLLPEAGRHLLVACALASISLNPLLFRLINPIENALRSRPRLWEMLNRRSQLKARQVNAPVAQRIAALERLAIVVGYGPVGRQVDRLLRQAGLETVVIDLNMDTVSDLQAQGRAAIYGDATRGELLEKAGAARATHLVLSTPQSADQQMLISAAKKLNPSIKLLVRTRYLRDCASARRDGADTTVVDEVESAVALTHLVLEETAADAESIDAEITRLRRELTG